MRRILVLGSASHSRAVDAYEWGRWPAALNATDYDTVILNCVPLADGRWPDAPRDPGLPPTDQLLQLLFTSGKELVVIGEPRLIEYDTYVSFDQSTVPMKMSHDLTAWLPQTPLFTHAQGTVVVPQTRDFEFYFQQVKSWSFYAEEVIQTRPLGPQFFVTVGWPSANAVTTTVEPIATNRVGRAIAVSLEFNLFHSKHAQAGVIKPGSASSALLTAHHSPLYWLPRATELTDIEAVDLLLAERYGVRRTTNMPQWVNGYRLPGQQKALATAVSLDSEIKKTQAQLAAAEKTLMEETRFHGLLYETGEVLEDVVRDALAELGASVHPPGEKGKDDGLVIDPAGCKGTLEIKGLTKSAGRAHVRQAHDWAANALAETNEDHKALLMVNAFRGGPVEDRAQVFPKDCVNLAGRFRVAMLTTTALFQAIKLKQEGAFDSERFWQTVFTTDGLCDLPEPQATARINRHGK